MKYDYRRQAHKRVEGLVSERLIKSAADILRWAPDHARMVLDTGQGWAEACGAAAERSKDARSEETRRAILADDEPELLARVGEDGLTIAEAWRVRETRIREQRETRARLTGYLVDRVVPLLGKPDAAELIEHYDPEHARRPIGVAELDEAIRYLQAVRSEMKRQQKG